MPAIAIALLCAPVAARATVITGVLPAALDLPEINCLFKATPDGTPFTGTGGFNVSALFSTGTNGILLSQETVAALNNVTTNIVPATSGGETVHYSRWATSGTETFEVSAQRPYMYMAPSYPGVDTNNSTTQSTVYGQNCGTCSLQLDPTVGSSLNIVGTPAVSGKVVVMDPKPLDGLLAGTLSAAQAPMRTYVNTPGVSPSPGNIPTPVTSRHIKMSYASSERFTLVTPDGAAGPTLGSNPFIGPSPGVPGDTTPAVSISLAGQNTTGSFLFDTGSPYSTISTSLASLVQVRYMLGDEPGSGNSTPTLEIYDPLNPGAAGTPIAKQFLMTIQEIGGGTKTVAGFYLDTLKLPTLEGNAMRFFDAPVLVDDITLRDTETSTLLTLDGVFGMNFLAASGENLNADLSSLAGDTQAGAFDWIVYDQSTGILGLQPKTGVQLGDANGDLACNKLDLDIVLANYNQSGKNFWEGDFNGDGSVNGSDLNTVLSYYNQSLPSESPDPVPEPSTILLGLLFIMPIATGVSIRRAWRK